MISAVRFLHKANIIHEDIKLNNWLARHNAAAPWALNICLIDFGIKLTQVSSK